MDSYQFPGAPSDQTQGGYGPGQTAPGASPINQAYMADVQRAQAPSGELNFALPNKYPPAVPPFMQGPPGSMPPLPGMEDVKWSAEPGALATGQQQFINHGFIQGSAPLNPAGGFASNMAVPQSLPGMTGTVQYPAQTTGNSAAFPAMLPSQPQESATSSVPGAPSNKTAEVNPFNTMETIDWELDTTRVKKPRSGSLHRRHASDSFVAFANFTDLTDDINLGAENPLDDSSVPGAEELFMQYMDVPEGMLSGAAASPAKPGSTSAVSSLGVAPLEDVKPNIAELGQPKGSSAAGDEAASGSGRVGSEQKGREVKDEEDDEDGSEDDDPLAPKRAKRMLANRQSAHRSRMRKLQYITDLETKVASLEKNKEELHTHMDCLKKYKLNIHAHNQSLRAQFGMLQEVLQQKTEMTSQLHMGLNSQLSMRGLPMLHGLPAMQPHQPLLAQPHQMAPAHQMPPPASMRSPLTVGMGSSNDTSPVSSTHTMYVNSPELSGDCASSALGPGRTATPPPGLAGFSLDGGAQHAQNMGMPMPQSLMDRCHMAGTRMTDPSRTQMPMGQAGYPSWKGMPAGMPMPQGPLSLPPQSAAVSGLGLGLAGVGAPMAQNAEMVMVPKAEWEMFNKMRQSTQGMSVVKTEDT